MSKNKPAPRIDLAYNKDLKYPDINDYLKDSMYASNLSDYPDNQRNAVVTLKAVPGTLRRRQITVGQNKAALWVWVADLKLFGYNPELELVDSMDLLIDSLDDGDVEEVEGTKIFPIFKRGSDLNLDLVQNSEIKAFKLPAIVNYSITIPIRSVIDLYNYVFGVRAKKAKAYFTGDEALTDEEFQESFLDNVYRWEIPALLRYYPVGSDKPDGFVGVEMSLSSVLPQYRKQIELDSSSVEYNTKFSLSSFDLFKLNYQTNENGRILIKAQLKDSPGTKQQYSEQIELDVEKQTSILSDFYAFQYIVYQHSGFYIAYPALEFKYDLYVSADNIAEVKDDLFGVFQPTAAAVVNNLTIIQVQSTMSVLPNNADTNNPFVVRVWFSCKNNSLAATKDRYKFILSFRQRQSVGSSKPDTSGFFNDNALDSTTIAGDFWTDTVKPRQVNTSKATAGRSSSVMYRSNAVSVEQKKVLSVFQRLTPDNDKYMSADLSKCSVNLSLLRSDDTKKIYYYRLDISWPASTNKTALYNLIKAPFVELSISDVFQQAIIKGLYARYFLDIYEDNANNPLYTNLPDWRANYRVVFKNSWTGITSPEVAAINQIASKKPKHFLFSVQQNNCKLQVVANLTGTEKNNITICEYNPLTYIALTSTEPVDTQPSRAYFCLQGMAMAASAAIKGGILQTPTFYPQSAKPLTNVRGEFNVINPVTYNTTTGRIQVTFSPQDVLNSIKKILGTTSFTRGVYYMYYIMNLNEIPDSESLIFTNLMTAATPSNNPRQKSTLIFVVKHAVK